MTTNMTCEAFDSVFADYLEGTLDAAAQAAVDQHLRECLRCAALARDVDNIRKEASALPDLVPSRDLWAGIESRIEAPVIPFAARPAPQRRFAPWMGVAAAALVISTAGVTYLLTARSLTPSQQTVASTISPAANEPQVSESDQNGSTNQLATPEPLPSGSSRAATRSASPTPPAAAPGGAARASLASRNLDASNSHSEVVYGKEIEMLQRIVSERKAQLDPATVAIIERNLTIIDAAIEQSRAALAKDPASMLLSQQLTHSLDKKVELLRTAALLPAST